MDARPQLSETAAAAAAAGTRVLIGSAVANTTGQSERPVDGVTVRSINDDGELTSGVEELACDLLAVSGGWTPAGAPALPAPGQAALGRRPRGVRAEQRGPQPADRRLPAAAASNSTTVLAEGISAGAPAAIAAGFDPKIRAAADPLVLSEPKASAPTRQLWLVPGQEGGPDGLAPPLRRLPARPVRGRRAALHRRRHALGGARQALHLDQHRQRPGQDLRGERDRRHRRGTPPGRRSVPGHRGHRHHHLPRPVHPGGVRGPRRTPARRAVRPGPPHLHPPLARGPRRPLRGRRPVEAPLVLPAGGRGHGRRGAARMRRRPRIRGLHGRHHPGQDRDPRQGRRRVPEPHLHQRVQEARPGFRPLRRDVHPGRHDLRRRRHPAPRRGPVLHDHHHRRRRQGPGLAGGMAADRMAGPGRALHLGHRTVVHHRRRRTEIPRRASRSWPRNWPRTAGWTPKPSRS